MALWVGLMEVLLGVRMAVRGIVDRFWAIIGKRVEGG